MAAAASWRPGGCSGASAPQSWWLPAGGGFGFLYGGGTRGQACGQHQRGPWANFGGAGGSLPRRRGGRQRRGRHGVGGLAAGAVSLSPGRGCQPPMAGQCDVAPKWRGGASHAQLRSAGQCCSTMGVQWGGSAQRWLPNGRRSSPPWMPI